MKLGFVVIYVNDVRETLKFYKEAFGFKIRMEYEDNGQFLYGEMETEGAILGFASHEMGRMNLDGKYQKSTVENDPFGQWIAFVSDDVHASYKKAVDAGAISVAEPHEKPWGQSVAIVRAKEGTLIELCSAMGA